MARAHLWMLPLIMGSLFFTVQTSESEEIDACSLEVGYVYCMCNSDTSEEATDANCFVQGEVGRGDPVWAAMAKMKEVNALSVSSRLHRKLTYLIPTKVFRGMRSLQFLEVKFGDLKGVRPFAFANSSSLIKIRLTDNLIRHLHPFSFSNMPKLDEISLGENVLPIVNHSIFVNLPHLKLLFLDKNRIQTIVEGAFQELISLQELELQRNNLTHISRGIFQGLGRLRRLDLRSNSIGRLGERVFHHTPKLEDLDLADNQILSVSPTAFYGLSSLKRLVLKRNKIVDLFPGSFASLVSIHHFDLRSNELETLRKGLFQNIYNNLRNASMEFMIEGNRFKCDCKILWIQQLWKDTAATIVRFHLNKTHCDRFQTPYELRAGLPRKKDVSPTSSSLTFRSNVTALATPSIEETTTYAFESTLKILDIDPGEFHCQDFEEDEEEEEESNAIFEDTRVKGQSQRTGREKSSASSIRAESSAASSASNQYFKSYNYKCIIILLNLIFLIR